MTGLRDWNPRVEVEGSRVLQGGYYNGVWPLARENDRYGILHLINLNGLEDGEWNSPRLNPPTPLSPTQVSVTMPEAPRAVYLVDPDGPDQSAVSLPFTYRDGQVLIKLNGLAYWAMVIFEK